MARHYEYPFDPTGVLPHDVAPHGSPATHLAALMECAPFEAPRRSVQELQPLRECLADALDTLGEREQWIIERHVIERLSVRDIAAMTGLSKSQVWRLKEGALAKLRDALSGNPLIEEELHG